MAVKMGGGVKYEAGHRVDANNNNKGEIRGKWGSGEIHGSRNKFKAKQPFHLRSTNGEEDERLWIRENEGGGWLPVT